MSRMPRHLVGGGALIALLAFGLPLSSAALARRNGLITYEHVGAANHFQLYTMTATGARRRPLTRSRRYSSSDPAYAPDGRRIVFVRDYKVADVNFGVAALTVDRGNNGVPSQLAPVTGSWCFPDDPVCQLLPDTQAWLAEVAQCLAGSCAHYNYPGTETGKAATFLGPFLP